MCACVVCLCVHVLCVRVCVCMCVHVLCVQEVVEVLFDKLGARKKPAERFRLPPTEATILQP